MEDDIDIKLSFGDIILARRMADDLEEHHEISPHIVVGREEDYIVVLQGTSQDKKGKYEYAYYKVEEGRHDLTQDTYFKIKEWRRIHKDKVLSKISKLSKSERKYLKKKIAFDNLSARHSEDWIDIGMPHMEVGDIIRDNNYPHQDNYYLIVEKNENKYKCMCIERIHRDDSINVNGTYYSFYYDKVVEIDNMDKYVRPDTLKLDQVKIILSKFKMVQNNLSEPKIDRGSLIGFNGELYYVYSIEKDNLLAYKVSLDKDDTHKEIKINEETYYTQFKEKTISKDEKIISIDKAKSLEIEENKKLKKQNSKQTKKIKEREKNLLNKAIQTGTCVSPHGNYTDKYIVIYRLGNEVCTIKYDDYLEGISSVELYCANEFTNPQKIQASEFSNILEFVKDVVTRGFHTKVFLDVYNRYVNITDIKEKQKMIEYYE